MGLYTALGALFVALGVNVRVEEGGPCVEFFGLDVKPQPTSPTP